MSRAGYEEYLKKMINDSDQGELTVETVLKELKEWLKLLLKKYKDFSLFFLVPIRQLKSYKHEDFDRVWDEIISKHQDKVVQIAKDIKLKTMANYGLYTADDYMRELKEILINNYFKYSVYDEYKPYPGHTFWYMNKKDAISKIEEDYEEKLQEYGHPLDRERFMRRYRLTGFKCIPRERE